MGFDTPLDWNYLNEGVGYFCFTDMQDVIKCSVFSIKPEHSQCRAFPVMQSTAVLHLFSNNTEPSAKVCCKFRTGEQPTFHISFLLQGWVTSLGLLLEC